MLSCQREKFQLPAGSHYLNCAYMSPLLAGVERAGIEGMRRKRYPAGITPSDFFTDVERTRALFARLIGADDPARVAVLPAVSYGIAVAAANIPVGEGQNIVLVEEQFPSNVLTWRRLGGEVGAELRSVEARESPRGELLNQRLLASIDAGTAVVAVGSVHWTDGTRLDLEEIGARAREVGAAFIIDGTQSVGALPFDVNAVRPDALICAGYKWLLGPYSVALGWFGPRFDGGRPLEETWMAREGSEDFRNLVHYRDEYRPGAHRYDVGGRSNFILLPMVNAALEQLLDWGVAPIRDYCEKLGSGLIGELEELGFTCEAPRWRSPHLFGLQLPEGLDRRRLNEELERRRIHVSLRGSAVRVAPHVYNDVADTKALADALREMLR